MAGLEIIVLIEERKKYKSARVCSPSFINKSTSSHHFVLFTFRPLFGHSCSFKVSHCDVIVYKSKASLTAPLLLRKESITIIPPSGPFQTSYDWTQSSWTLRQHIRKVQSRNSNQTQLHLLLWSRCCSRLSLQQPSSQLHTAEHFWGAAALPTRSPCPGMQRVCSGRRVFFGSVEKHSKRARPGNAAARQRVALARTASLRLALMLLTVSACIYSVFASELE